MSLNSYYHNSDIRKALGSLITEIMRKNINQRPPPKAHWMLMAKIKYEDEKGLFIISYGDRESIVEIRYKRKIDNYIIGVWELFSAKGWNYKNISGSQFVFTSDLMKKTIVGMSRELKDRIAELFPIDVQTQKIISENRKKALEDFDKKVKQEAMDRHR
jgi:hypothetical protein